MHYLKVITTARFLVSLEVINATLKLNHNSCKKATGHQEIILTALDATSIISCKEVIQTFRNNEEIYVGLFRHAEGLCKESILMPRIVNRQANRANPLAVSPLQFFRRSVFLPFIDTVLEYLSKRFRSDLFDCIKL